MSPLIDCIVYDSRLGSFRLDQYFQGGLHIPNPNILIYQVNVGDMIEYLINEEFLTHTERSVQLSQKWMRPWIIEYNLFFLREKQKESLLFTFKNWFTFLIINLYWFTCGVLPFCKISSNSILPFGRLLSRPEDSPNHPTLHMSKAWIR